MTYEVDGNWAGRTIARRDFLKLGGAGLAGAALLGVAGCRGGDQRGAESRENVKGAKTLVEGKGGGEEIVYWTSFTGAVEVDALKRIVNSFNEQSSDAQVTMIQVPGDVTDVSKLMTAVRGGSGPDVYHLDRFTVAQRAADGVLQPLDEFRAQDLEEQYLESAWDEVMFKGKPYALPFDSGVHGGLFYRKDMLEEAGADLGEFEPENGPITISRLKEVADSLDVTEGSSYTRLGFVPWLYSGFPYTWGFVFGGEFFDPESCEVTPTDPAIVQAFQTMYYDWAGEKGPQKVQEFVNTYFPPGGNPAQDPFFTGHLGMLVLGEWYIPLISKYAKDLDYGVTYLPVPEEGQFAAGWSGGWSAVIPQGVQNPEAAYEFASYMCGEEAQRIYVEDTQHLPTWKSLLENEDLYPGNFGFFRDLLPDSKVRPALPVGAQYWDELTAAQESVYLNKAQPEPALQNVKDRVQQRLERYCPIEG